jgi:hypothetical protein
VPIRVSGGFALRNPRPTTFLIADRPHNAKRVMRSAREADNRLPQRHDTKQADRLRLGATRGGW